MNDEWILSVIDVAEALKCSTDDVVGFITSGELIGDPDNPAFVSHAAVRAFVAERQRAALQLGADARIAPDVLALRPVFARFDD